MDGYKELANAVKDYRKALKYDERGCKREFEKFFMQEQFAVLNDVSDKMLIAKLRLEVKEVVIK